MTIWVLRHDPLKPCPDIVDGQQPKHVQRLPPIGPWRREPHAGETAVVDGGGDPRQIGAQLLQRLIDHL